MKNSQARGLNKQGRRFHLEGICQSWNMTLSLEAPERGLETTPGTEHAGASPGGPSPRAGPWRATPGPWGWVSVSGDQLLMECPGLEFPGWSRILETGLWTRCPQMGVVWVIPEKQGRHSNSIPQVGHYVQWFFKCSNKYTKQGIHIYR